MTKKYIKKTSFAHVVLIAVAVVLVWRGAWGLMDLYIFPDNALISYIVSLVAGLLILLATKEIADLI